MADSMNPYDQQSSKSMPDILVHNERDDVFNKGGFAKMAAKLGIDDTTLFKKTAKLALYNLIRYTPMHIRENRLKGCRTYFHVSEFFNRENATGIRIFAYRTGCNKKTYLSQIAFSNPLKPGRDPKANDYFFTKGSFVWVHCTCPYFKFNLEYVMDKMGASTNVYAWNKPPVIKNPNMVPGACKHILTTIDDAIRRSKQYKRLDLENNKDFNKPKIDIEPEKGKGLQKLPSVPPKQTEQPIEKIPNKQSPQGPQGPQGPQNQTKPGNEKT